MADVDMLPTRPRPRADSTEPDRARPRPLGARFARSPLVAGVDAPRLGEHSKTYTFDKKTEQTKFIIDGKEESHPDTTEVERETD